MIYLSFRKVLFFFPKTVKNGKLVVIKGQKMSRDTLVNHLPPLFGDTVVTPRPPQECHILYEWLLDRLP